jgi:S-methylmethionine-dependent homocysteine/selenocysteine methylase
MIGGKTPVPSRTIRERLQSGDVLLLDGATGSELGRRGVNVSKGSTTEKLGPWSATANVDAPNLVRQVHEDYLRLGADIITSNSFWTNRPRLGMIGLADQWEEYTRAAGEIAVQARSAVNPEAYVAGGIAPPGEGDLRAEFVDLSRVLVGVGADLMLAEYVGTIADCVTVVDACATSGLPVFLGVRHISPEGDMQYGESLEDLGRALEGHPVDAVLLMCSRPEAISAGLPILRRSFAGPIGGYANIGYTKNPEFGSKRGDQWHTIDQDTYYPDRYAGFARAWLDLGAQIVGGCCATGPEHIEAVAGVLRERRR